jgi:hypothetical protein
MPFDLVSGSEAIASPALEAPTTQVKELVSNLCWLRCDIVHTLRSLLLAICGEKTAVVPRSLPGRP